MSHYWSPATLRNAHLLVIDDNTAELKVLLEMLRNNGYRLSVAMDAMQGYRRATAQQIDLILLDVHLGSVDGFAVCRLLKADAALADIPVIFVSSGASLQERLQGLRCGAVDYITKPFEPAEVLARVEIHLALARRHKTQARDAALSTNQIEALPAATPALQSESERALSQDLTLLRAAQQIVLADLSRVPSLPELAIQLGTYEKRLARIFLEHTGRTPYDFIRQARLHEARRMLADSIMRIDEVAQAVGFSSAANFSTAFRLHFDCTPTAFRRANPPPPRHL